MKVLLGIGNPLARDDGVGVWVAENFRKKGWFSFPARQAPENVIGKIARIRPVLLVAVDAVEMGLEPGEFRRLLPERDRGLWGSTHSLPLWALLKRCVPPSGTIVFLGIQPKDLSLGEGLSPEVEAGARRLLRLLLREELNAIPQLEPEEGE
ncbi:hydrogenase maturation protease [Candidatus Bipolaricaulota bacterium]|nr:hydrogenase maturation protease [Candidatus Bipolaricaulota bacterium]RLE31476.1 MAG: hydrogenase 3 maturation endopeptidase HyCI [Candidatus Acetothermia bacterium]RLE33557.1 MAG: hydrogenase 3 maturation endopeptidase HyCI [Candidatus Acetothermia bacterium]HDC92999.1 hydrogenase maturation protease [Candidatus Acetothermia bacterium]